MAERPRLADVTRISAPQSRQDTESAFHDVYRAGMLLLPPKLSRQKLRIYFEMAWEASGGDTSAIADGLELMLERGAGWKFLLACLKNGHAATSQTTEIFERAVSRQTTALAERAVPSQTPVRYERAAFDQATETDERAVRTEAPASDQRAENNQASARSKRAERPAGDPNPRLNGTGAGSPRGLDNRLAEASRESADTLTASAGQPGLAMGELYRTVQSWLTKSAELIGDSNRCRRETDERVADLDFRIGELEKKVFGKGE